jgi:hypothetical protein
VGRWRDIVTHYGLDGLGIESLCGRDFPHLSSPAHGPNQHLICTTVTGSLLGVKWSGYVFDQPLPSSAEV